MRIGILGGTFDPVHQGHISLATCAIKSHALDKVIFMPTGIKTYKTANCKVSDENRLEMLKIAIRSDSRLQVDPYEMQIGKIGYTSETLDYIHSIYPEDDIFFIIGADSLMYIHKWHNPKDIFEKCTIISGNRIVDGDINKQKAFLESKYSCSILLMDGPDVKISSSEIRDMLLKRELDALNHFMPYGVLEYILERNLYINA